MTSIESLRSPSKTRRADLARNVADLLRCRIMQGNDVAPAPGQPLEGEEELARQFGVSRNVVRMALHALQREGIVARVQGAGTFVVVAKTHYRNKRLQGLSRGVGERSRTVHHELRLADVRPAPSVVAQRLEQEVDSEVLVVERRTLVQGFPFAVTTRYVRGRLAVGLLQGDLQTDDWYGLLEEVAGEPLSGAQLATEAIAADELIAPLLDLSVGKPILGLERVVKTTTDEPVEFSFTRCRGDRIRIETWLSREGI